MHEALNADDCCPKQSVWYLDVFQRVDNVVGFRSDLFEEDREAYARLYTLFARGELPAEEMPERMWVMADSTSKNRKKLPNFVYAGDFLAVSGDVARVLRKYDLGASILKEVDFLMSDRRTPFPGGWYLLQIVERKVGFEPEHSSNYKLPVFPDHFDFLGTVKLYDDVASEISVNSSTLKGADLWRDPLLNASFFVSETLMVALQKADVLGPLGLLQCKVIDS